MTVFDDSSAWQYYKARGGGPQLKIHLGHMPHIDEHPEEDRRAYRIAIALALVFHIGLFMFHLPSTEATPRRIGSAPRVYILQQVRFAPPPPAPRQLIPKQREKRRVIPVPDPTPDEPEPIRLDEIEVPDAPLSDIVGEFGIPDVPPGFGRGGVDAVPVSGNIRPPVKIHYPQPHYTEDARRARVQGVVILEATINRKGQVVDVKVLKGLPMGLTESAVETVKQWLYRPATRDGEPVAVFFNLTVSFTLQ